MANLELPFGINVLNPKPLDAKYLNDGVPYVDISEVNSIVGAGIRHTGLTVNISGVEYWYASGIGDGDLVVKTGGSGGSGERIEKEYTQVTHGFSVGEVIAYSGTSFIKAIADGVQDAEVVGIVTEVADVNNFTVVFDGYIEGITSLGLSGGTTYFLSTTIAGELTAENATVIDTISKPILTTFTVDDALVFQYREFNVTSGTTSGGGVSGITEIENIGTGTGEVFSATLPTISGQTSSLRTITGSGDTTVSTVGDDIIIFSSGGSGSIKEVILTTAANVTVSGISVNTLFLASGTTGYTLSSSPTTGAELTFSDGVGDASTNNIVVEGNGKNILDGTNGTINTNYGSFTIIYNGVFWTVTAHVP